MKKTKIERRSGFTLIELMVVVAILGILATFVVREVMSNIPTAKIAKAQSDIQNFAGAIRQFSLRNNGKLPEALDILAQPDENGVSYLQDTDGEVPPDPWGNDYFYKPDGNGITFEIGSYGADGQPGGEGVDSDITNKTIHKRNKEG